MVIKKTNCSNWDDEVKFQFKKLALCAVCVQLVCGTKYQNHLQGINS